MKRMSIAGNVAMAVAVTLTLAACSGGGEAAEPVTKDPSDVEGTVTFWTYPVGGTDASWWEPQVEAFNEEYPNVEVEVVVQPFTNREETLVTSIAGGVAPDVVYFNPDFIPRFADEDLLVPLDDMVDDDFVKASVDAFTWKDTVYSVPLLMQLQTSYCNTAVLAAAGVATCPTTWDELAAAGPPVVDAGFYLTEYNGALSMTLNQSFYPYLWQAGGEVLSDDLKSAAFNGPEGVAALEFIKKMVDNGWVPEQPLTVVDPFEQTAAGRAEAAYVGSATLTATRAVVDPAVIEVAPPMTHVEQVAAGSVGGFSVFNTTDTVEGSKAWIKFITSPEVMESFLEETGYLPPRKSLTGLFEDDPQIASGLEYLDKIKTGVMHPKARQIMDTLSPFIQSVLLDKAEPQAALDDAAVAVDELLSRP